MADDALSDAIGLLATALRQHDDAEAALTIGIMNGASPITSLPQGAAIALELLSARAVYSAARLVVEAAGSAFAPKETL